MKIKQATALLLALVVLLGLAVPGAAAPAQDIKVAQIVESPFGIYEGNAAIDPERTTPGDEIIIPILAVGFKDADGANIVWKQDDLGTISDPDATDRIYDLGPSVLQLKSNGIKPQLLSAGSLAVIRDYEFVKYTPSRSVPAQAALRIRFVEDYVSVSEFVYKFTIYLHHRGELFDTQETFGGMMKNEELEVYKKDYVNLEDGLVAKSLITAQNVKVGLGNGVNLYSDLFEGEKYYGVAKHYGNAKQNVILDSYPEITEWYELKTVNLKTHGDLVEFTKYKDKPYYVYNLKGEYLGTTDDRLAYSTRYYLSQKFLEIEVDEALLDRDIGDQFPAPFPSKALDKFAAGLAEDAAEQHIAPVDFDEVVQ